MASFWVKIAQKCILRGQKQWSKPCIALGGNSLSWNEVLNGVPQGSVLGPALSLFLIFITDLPSVVQSITKLFADDTKLFLESNLPLTVVNVKLTFDKLMNWSLEWKLSFNMFNTSKCHVMHPGKNNGKHNYTMGLFRIQRLTKITWINKEKDLGVLVFPLWNSLSIVQSLQLKSKLCGGTNQKTTFTSVNTTTTLYKTIVQPVMEYVSGIWSPYLIKDINLLQLYKSEQQECVLS